MTTWTPDSAARYNISLEALRGDLEQAHHVIAVMELNEKKCLDEVANLRAQIETLRQALETAIELLEEARSGYIGGSGPSIQWEDQRDKLFLEARAALTTTEPTLSAPVGNIFDIDFVTYTSENDPCLMENPDKDVEPKT